MKYFLALILILLVQQEVKSQNLKSSIYNSNGQLYIDTSLSVSSEQYKSWSYVESNLIYFFSKLELPTIYLENVVYPKGIIIVSFTCDSNDISNIKVLNDTSYYAKRTILGLKKQSRNIASELKLGASYSSNGKYLGLYYIPINFKLIDFHQELRKSNAVPIIKSTVPIFNRGIQ